MKIITRNEAIERGLTRFFTGKACIHGHICERYTLSCTCIDCNNELQAKRRKKIVEIREKLKTE